jgi:hypothetical protein
MLKKDFIIMEIRAAPNGAPHVYVTLKDPSEVEGSYRPVTPVGMASFESMDDMLKNLGNVISKQMFGGMTTVIRLGLDEYDKLNINVGDRISLTIRKLGIDSP